MAQWNILHQIVKTLRNLFVIWWNTFSTKKVESDKANDVNDLKDIGEATWRFIFSLYESEWDEFIADSNNHSFRYKVKAQFTLKINEGSNIKNSKYSNTNKPALIFKLPSPILVKLPKKVNKISKYFKKNIKKKDQKNHMFRLLLLLILLGKLWKSRKSSLIYKIKKLKTFKKSSEMRTNPNLNSI